MKAIVLCALISTSLFVDGCATYLPPFYASIEPHNGWHIGLDCGYEVCQPVEALFTTNLVIRLEPIVEDKEDLFFIKITFVNYGAYEIDFDPSATTALFGSTRIHPKIRECGTTPHFVGHYKEALRRAEGITDIQHIKLKTTTCFVLFFDLTLSSLGNRFALNIGQLAHRDKIIAVPPINFSGLRTESP